MSRRKRVKKKGLNPVVAILILLGSSAFVAKSLMGSSGQQAVAEVAEFMGLQGMDELDLGEQQQGAEIVWRDLLAEHGSYDRKTVVRLAFAAMVNSDTVAAAPVGEIAHPGARWVGEDPPTLRLGVVMVSEKSRRAVFGGSVVGVGDVVDGGEVVSIEPGTLRLRWQQRLLTYDLDGDVPREFRAESIRRDVEQQKASGANEGSAAASKEQGTEEK